MFRSRFLSRATETVVVPIRRFSIRSDQCCRRGDRRCCVAVAVDLGLDLDVVVTVVAVVAFTVVGAGA